MERKYRLLIIDDEQAILDTYGSYFLKRGFVVDTCDNGEEGLQHLLDIDYDVALVDLRMPNSKLDGLEVIRQAVEQDTNADIIVITAHGDKQDAVQALNYGADAWFDKSGSDMSEIFTRVKELAEGMPIEKLRAILAALPEDD